MKRCAETLRLRQTEFPLRTVETQGTTEGCFESPVSYSFIAGKEHWRAKTHSSGTRSSISLTGQCRQMVASRLSGFIDISAKMSSQRFRFNDRELLARFLAGDKVALAAGTVPAAASLTQGILKMMGLNKLKYISICILSLHTAGGITYGVLQDDPTRFEKGLRGNIVAVNEGNPAPSSPGDRVKSSSSGGITVEEWKPATVTISLEGFDTLLNLDVSRSSKIWTAYEVGQFSDLKEGQYVSLRLADDHRTVNEIHVEGEVQSVAIKSLTSGGKITVVHHDDDDDDEERDRRTEVELAPDVIVRIGGLPATREDLNPGMEVELEFGRDGKFVHAITSEAAEELMFEGQLTGMNNDNTRIFLEKECDDEQITTRSFTITPETIVWVDLKPAKLADLKSEMWLVVRLSEDGNTVRAIKATTPEPEDDDDEDE